MLITLYIFVILTLLWVLLSKIFSKIFRPYSMSQLRKSKEDRVYTATNDFTLDNIQETASKRLPIINMSEDLEIDITKKITRLGLDTTADKIRKLQLLYLVVTLVVSVLVRPLFGDTVSLVIAIMSLYAWRYPIIHINNKIKARDEAIKVELPEMYAVMYYAYKRTSSVNITGIVQSYIKDSSDLFYKEMMLFIQDSKNGEIYALQEFKKRVPLAVVARFTDIMQSRLIGEDNVNVMYNFKKEMDDKRKEREDKLLEELTNKLNIISWIGIMIPMSIILVIYFAAQMMSAFTG